MKLLELSYPLHCGKFHDGEEKASRMLDLGNHTLILISSGEVDIYTYKRFGVGLPATGGIIVVTGVVS